MEYLFIYAMQLAGGLEGVQTVCIIFDAIAFILLAVAVHIAIEENYGWTEEDCKDFPADMRAFKVRKILAKMLCVCSITAVLLSFVPKEKTLALMGGVYLGKKVATAASMDTKLDKVNAIIEHQLDKYLKELKQNDD